MSTLTPFTFAFALSLLDSTRSGDGGAGEEPFGRRRGRPARRDGRGLHLHHAGGAGRRASAGHRRFPCGRLRAPMA